MSFDPNVINQLYSACVSVPLAITSHYEGRDNGLMISSGACGSVTFDGPRILIGICKPNFSHDLIMKSQKFTVHALARGPEDAFEKSKEILMTLGGSSGRDGDKISSLSVKRGVTGCPILTDSLVYAECAVVNSMDGDENTFFLGDVLVAEQLGEGPPANGGALWNALPKVWTEAYDKKHADPDGLVEQSRRLRGLPPH